ncbi:hypothetical protein ACLBXI_28785 [Bacillus cereus]
MTIYDLDTLGGAESKAYGVNNNGFIVGEAEISGNRESHACYWTPSRQIHDLGVLLAA